MKVVELATQRTSVSDLATTTLLHRPGAAGEVVRALLAGSASQEVGGVEPEAIAAAGALLAAGPVTVVLGRANVAESADAVVAAASAIHAAHPQVRFLSALRRGNVHGALDMGLAPGLLPGRTSLADGGAWFKGRGWSKVPGPARPRRHRDPAGGRRRARSTCSSCSAPIRSPTSPTPTSRREALAGARTVIAVDRFLTALGAAGRRRARRQRSHRDRRHHHEPRGAHQHGGPEDHPARHRARRLDARQPSWLACSAPTSASSRRPRSSRRSCRSRRATSASPSTRSTGARDGVVVGEPRAADPASTAPPVLGFTAPSTAEPPAVDAYSLRLVAQRRLYDLGTDAQHSPGLAGLTSDTVLRLHPHDFDRLGVSAGSVVTATSSKGSVSLPVESDDRVGRGAAAVVLNQPGATVGALIDATAAVTEIRVVKA